MVNSRSCMSLKWPSRTHFISRSSSRTFGFHSAISWTSLGVRIPATTSSP